MLSIKTDVGAKATGAKGWGRREVVSQKGLCFLVALKKNRNFTRRKGEIKINYYRQRKCQKERYEQINEQGKLE